MSDASDIGQLRRAFAARVLPSASGECPSAEALLSAAQGDVDAAAMGALADHLLQCHGCAEAWRLAQAFVPAPERAPAPRAASWQRYRAASWQRYTGVAAAAVLVLAVGVVWRSGPGEGPGEGVAGTAEPVYRDAAPELVLQPLSATALPRSQFLLRWRAPAGSGAFTVRLFTADLAPVQVSERLAQTQLLVPAAALQSFPDGAQLIWQVEGRAADGAVLRSPTWSVALRPGSQSAQP